MVADTPESRSGRFIERVDSTVSRSDVHNSVSYRCRPLNGAPIKAELFRIEGITFGSMHPAYGSRPQIEGVDAPVPRPDHHNALVNGWRRAHTAAGPSAP